MKANEIQWILSLSKEQKFIFLEAILKQKKYSYWFELIDVLLEAPVSKGGISTEEINSIWYKYIKKQIMNTQERKEAKRELITGFVFLWSVWIGYYLVMKIITL